jgi:hypothetical protein
MNPCVGRLRRWRRPVSGSRRDDDRWGLLVTAIVVLSGLTVTGLSLRPASIVLSHTSGFYSDAIAVEIRAPRGHVVFYTTDGSYPDPDGNPSSTKVVDGPLLIEDRSNDPNIFAAIETRLPERWEFVPPPTVPKATVLRARSERSSEVFATFFVGEAVAQRSLPTLSLIADPSYLFDPELGIRVLGDLTDAWRSSERYVEAPSPAQIEANYQMRGREWERPLRETIHNPVVIEFCDLGGDCVMQQSIGIRTHGGYSRSFSPDKSWRLYAREEYGIPAFTYPFFGAGTPEHTRLILRNSGNDWNRLRFRDAFWQSIFPDTWVETQAYLPVRLFLNGEYWGIYNLRERIDAHYFDAKYSIARGDIELLDNSTNAAMQGMREARPDPQAPRESPSDPAWRTAWVEFVESLPGDERFGDDTTKQIESAIHVQSFYDFVIANTFAGQIDWLSNNTRWWRVTEGATSQSDDLRDGRWRWALADFDSAGAVDSPFMDDDKNRSRITDIDPASRMRRGGFPFVFDQMMSSPLMRDGFLIRYADLMNTALHPSRTTRELEALVRLLEPEMPLSRSRWSVGDMDEWFELVLRMSRFLEERPEAMRAELVEYFELLGTFELTVEYPADAGAITVNTIIVTEQRPIWADPVESATATSWTGVYFQGIAVTVEAPVDAGRPFVGWAGIPTDSVLHPDGSVTFVSSEDVAIRALFRSPLEHP